MRVDIEGKSRPLRIGRCIGEHAESARKALDRIEQQGRTIRQPGGDLRDPTDFETRLRTIDAPQCPQCLDFGDELAQVPIGHLVYSWAAGGMPKMNCVCSPR